MATGTGSDTGSTTGTGSGAVPPPPPPPGTAEPGLRARLKSTTQMWQKKFANHKWIVVGGIVAGLAGILILGSGIMGLFGYMNSPNTAGAIAAADPDAATDEDNDPGESDQGEDDVAPEPAPVVVAEASPCRTPEGLTDEGHMRCLEHVLILATALTPDWHQPAP